jgi:L-amino acid N-acyltransferase YncA
VTALFFYNCILLSCPFLEIKTILALIFGHNHPGIQFFKKNGLKQWEYLPGVANLDGISRDVAIYGLHVNISNLI